MFYEYLIKELPYVTKFYTVTRNTVWQITDSDNILIIIKEGTCRITCGCDSQAAKKGDIVFIPAGHSYTREPIDMTLCTMLYIHFKSDRLISEIFPSELSSRLSAIKHTLDEKILGGSPQAEYQHTVFIPFLCSAMADEISDSLKKINIYSSRRPLMCSLQSSVAICNILLLLSQKTIDGALEDDKISDTPVIPEKLRKAIGYISKNFSRNITLEQLSSCCAVSKSQLIRYFRQTFGKTPLDYITDYRISRAKELIFNYPQLTFKEISYELGFDNQHYFSRVFKKLTGETPSHYRNRVLNYDDSKTSSPNSADL